MNNNFQPASTPLTRVSSVPQSRLQRAQKPGLSHAISTPVLANVHKVTMQTPPKAIIATHPEWKIEEPAPNVGLAIPDIDDDVYANEFANKHPHVCLVGLKSGKTVCICAVQKNPSVLYPNVSKMFHLGPSFRALIVNKEGYEEFYLYNTPISKGGSDPSQEFADVMNKKIIEKDLSFYTVSTKDIIKDLLDLEIKHSLKVDKMKIAVLYVAPGQSHIKDIFSNQPPQDSRFYRFMHSIGEEINPATWQGYRGDLGKSGTDVDKSAYYTKFGEVHVIFHLGPHMDAEQHRRLLGNDIAVIIFYDNDDVNCPFNIFGSIDMGVVPHIFAVVQPHIKGLGYRLGFFSRPNVPDHPPSCPPYMHYFEAPALKHYMLTKLLNGYAKARTCPPMKTLFTVPRAAAITEIGNKYPATPGKGLSRASSHAHKMEKHLTVQLHKAKNLASKDSNGLSDPYVVLSIDDKKRKSKIQFKTLNPEWNEIFKIPFDGSDEYAELHVVLFDHDDIGGDDYMGEFTVYLSAVAKLTEGTWFPVKAITSEFATGEIMLSFHVDN